jgi:DNA-binding response OmpR family regulator
MCVVLPDHTGSDLTKLKSGVTEMRILMSVTTWDGARIEAGLRESGFLTSVARDGIEVFESLDLLEHPVVLIETDLPDMRWKVALSQLRKEQPNLAILAIDNNDSVDDTIAAFELGADDVIDPRMHTEEAVHRILSVAARRAGHAGQTVRIGELSVDLRKRDVFWRAERVEMSPSQYEIFEMLVLKPNGAVSKEQIMGQLYGVEDGPDPRVIDVFLCKLRARFAEVGAPQGVIETVRGRGFRLNVAQKAREKRYPMPFADGRVPIEFPKAA